MTPLMSLFILTPECSLFIGHVLLVMLVSAFGLIIYQYKYIIGAAL